MITKSQLDAANEAVEAHQKCAVDLAADLAHALNECDKMKADLAASQQRECALRDALELVLEKERQGYASFCGILYTKEVIVSALSNPSPQGWVKLRWRPGTEPPKKHYTDILCRNHGRMWVVQLGTAEVLPSRCEWLYASELLEGGKGVE